MTGLPDELFVTLRETPPLGLFETEWEAQADADAHRCELLAVSTIALEIALFDEGHVASGGYTADAVADALERNQLDFPVSALVHGQLRAQMFGDLLRRRVRGDDDD